MRIILGERFYERTQSGKYPKYNLEQMNIFVIKNCSSYNAICVMDNVLCFDMFGKYTDNITKKQRKELDKELKNHYGLVNVSVGDLVDWQKFKYNKVFEEFVEV